MKTIISLAFLLALSSCGLFGTSSSTPKSLSFSEKRNCSPKAIEYITKRDEAREKKVTLYEHNQLQIRTVDFFLTKEADLQSCYKESSNEYHVCLAIGVNAKSQIDFAQADDLVNNLDAGIKACLEKKLMSYNYKSLKATHGTKFIMPLKLSLKK